MVSAFLTVIGPDFLPGCQRPQNLISYHLRLLREGQVVQERRSRADD